VLTLITKIDGSDHKAWRFLGECLLKTNAPTERVMSCYEQALSGNPDYPQYLANIGSLMLQDGATGAEAFLERLAVHRRQHPLAANEFVEAIEANCLEKVGRSNEASKLRRERVSARSSHLGFYCDEAEYQLAQGNPVEAIRFLDLARQNGAEDDYTISIRCKVLETLGRGAEASHLRLGRIAAKSKNPALYNAEAEYQFAQGDPVEAIRLLDLAQRHGATDGYTDPIRSKALKAPGRGA
jgi:tetratricopeptide (TPR) repeat protein